MTVSSPRILEGPLTRALVIERPDPSLDALLRRSGLQVVREDAVPSRERLLSLLREVQPEVLLKRSQVVVDEEVLQAAPQLIAVQLCSIGDDSVDKAACARRGVLVLNDPVSNGRSVVELCIAHLIALSRRLYDTCAQTRQSQWRKSADGRYEIQGRVLGIMGLGKIGRAVARAAEGLGMEIAFYDDRPVAQEVGREMGWSVAPDPQSLFRGADAVTLHLSAANHLGQRNDGVVTEALLRQLGADRGPDSPRLFINLARGSLHTTEALISAVEAGAVRQAAVDVFPDEPVSGVVWHNPYAHHPAIHGTPHIGAATMDAQPRIAARVAATLHGLSHRGALRDCVFGPNAMLDVETTAQAGAILQVQHSNTRGTKKALDEAIYEAGADNLSSVHQDFSAYHIAINLNLLDRPLSPDQLARIVARTTEVTGDPDAVKWVRQMRVG